MIEIAVSLSRREARQRTMARGICAFRRFALAVGSLIPLGLGAAEPQPGPAWTESLAPPTFEANVGQFDGTYAARVFAGNAAIYLSHAGAVSVRPARSLTHGVAKGQRGGNGDAGPGGKRSATPRVVLRGSNPDPEIVLESPASTRSHYYIGADPEKWHVNVPHFEQVRFRDVYPGIDQVFHAASGKLEFDFVVRPGAEPHAIRLAVEAGGEISVDGNGDLAIGIAGARMVLKQPVAYQKNGVEHSPVAAKYGIDAGGAVSIDLGPYDRNEALVVDPVLDYSTFVGGSKITGIAVDAEGAAYLAGTTAGDLFDSPDADLAARDIPVDYAHSYSSGENAFVLKVAPDGQHVAYIALLGSSWMDRSAGIAVTADKEAILGAVTSATDYPMVKPLRNRLHDIEAHATYNVVTKLAADGSSIRYSYYHSRRRDAPFEIGRVDPLVALDPQGNTVVATAGELPGAPVPRPPPTDPGYGCGGIIVTRLTSSGDSEDVALCLAGTTINALAVDHEARIHVAGSALSAFFGKNAISTPVANPTAYDTAIWISKIDLANAQVIHHTTLAGGSFGRDEARGIAADSDGNSYITGFTTSPQFPLVKARESGLTTRKLPVDLVNRRAAFVSKLDPSGGAILYSTFLNLDGDPDVPPFVSGLFVDANQHAVISGNLASNATGSGTADNVRFDNMFVAKLSDSGDAVLYNYRLGGRYQEFDTVMAAGRPREIYVAGFSTSPDFPLQAPIQGWNGGVRSTNAFGTSGQAGTTFLARIIEETPVLTMTMVPTSNPAAVRSPVWVTAEVPAATGDLAWYIDDQLFATQALTSGQRQIAFSPGALRRGTHIVRASYQPADRSVQPLDAEYLQSVDAPRDCP